MPKSKATGFWNAQTGRPCTYLPLYDAVHHWQLLQTYLFLILRHSPIFRVETGVVIIGSIQQGPHMLVLKFVSKARLQQLVTLGMACQSVLLMPLSWGLLVGGIRAEQLLVGHFKIPLTIVQAKLNWHIVLWNSQILVQPAKLACMTFQQWKIFK